MTNYTTRADLLNGQHFNVSEATTQVYLPKLPSEASTEYSIRGKWFVGYNNIKT